MGADHRAFLEATLPYVDVVWQVARQAAGDGQEPEDLVQETYLRAYAAFGSYRGESMRAWLAAICLNVARSEARRRRRRPWEVPARTVLRLAKDWGLPAVAVERVSWVKVVDQRIRVVTGVADAAGSEPGIAQPW